MGNMVLIQLYYLTLNKILNTKLRNQTLITGIFRIVEKNVFVLVEP